MKIFVPMTSTDARKGSSRGLLLGSGGNTLRSMQSESKCKLTIKGKGSSKGSHEVAPGTDSEEEDLHLLVEYDGPASGRDQVYWIIRKMLGHGTRCRHKLHFPPPASATTTAHRPRRAPPPPQNHGAGS